MYSSITLSTIMLIMLEQLPQQNARGEDGAICIAIREPDEVMRVGIHHLAHKSHAGVRADEETHTARLHLAIGHRRASRRGGGFRHTYVCTSCQARADAHRRFFCPPSSLSGTPRPTGRTAATQRQRCTHSFFCARLSAPPSDKGAPVLLLVCLSASHPPAVNHVVRVRARSQH